MWQAYFLYTRIKSGDWKEIQGFDCLESVSWDTVDRDLVTASSYKYMNVLFFHFKIDKKTTKKGS